MDSAVQLLNNWGQMTKRDPVLKPKLELSLRHTRNTYAIRQRSQPLSLEQGYSNGNLVPRVLSNPSLRVGERTWERGGSNANYAGFQLGFCNV